MQKRTLPVMLCVEDKPCLVVGGGAVALRKVRWLRSHGLRVQALSLEFSQDFREENESSGGGLELCEEKYSARDLSPYALVFACTDDEEVNRCVAADAKKAGSPVNVADAPELCTFHVPSTLRRGKLSITVATDGASPALARRITKELAGTYGEWHAKYVSALGRVRDSLRGEIDDIEKRAAALRHIAGAGLCEKFAEMEEDEIYKSLLEAARNFME